MAVIYIYFMQIRSYDLPILDLKLHLTSNPYSECAPASIEIIVLIEVHLIHYSCQ
jgi:hypothetical protein